MDIFGQYKYVLNSTLRAILFFVWGAISTSLLCAQKDTNVLLNNLKNTKIPKEKVDILVSLGTTHKEMGHYLTSLLYYEKANVMASVYEKDRIDYTSYLLGHAYRLIADDACAFVTLNQTIQLNPHAKFAYIGIAQLFTNRGEMDSADYYVKKVEPLTADDFYRKSNFTYLYHRQKITLLIYAGRFSEAMAMTVNALSSIDPKEQGYGTRFATLSELKAILFTEMKKNDSAAVAYQEIIRFYKEKQPHSTMIATSMYNLAEVYVNQKAYQKADTVLRELHGYCVKEDWDEFFADIYNSKATLNYLMGDFQAAEKNRETALEHATYHNAPMAIGQSYFTKGQIHLAKQEFSQAVAAFVQCGGYWEKVAPAQNKRDLWDALQKAYRGVGNTPQAFAYLEKWRQLNDSIYNRETTQLLYDLEAKYQSEKKEHMIAEQQKKNKELELQIVNFRFIVIGILLMFVFLVILWRLIVRNRVLDEEVAKRTAKIQEQADKLKSLDAMKSTFFANISHELRTPLTLIIEPIRHLLKTQSLSPDQKSDLTAVMKQGQDLLMLVNEILDIEKVESSTMRLNIVNVELSTQLQQITENFQAFAATKGVTVVLQNQLPPTLTLALDIQKVEKILKNVITNAIRYTPQGEKVVVGAQMTDTHLLIHVRDFGEGVHPQDVPYIFDRFYQSTQPEKQSKGGTGIGLALSKSLAQLMDGDIFLENYIGEGADFILTLPYDKHAIKEQEAVSVPSILPLEEQEWMPQSPQNQAGILLVEDNAEMRQFLTKILSPFYEVIAMPDGFAAYQFLSENSNKVQLILSDMMMPIMDGMQLLEKVKKDDHLRGLPFLILSARTALPDKLSALRIGVDDYLTKPFESEELLIRIAHILKLYQQKVAFRQEENKLAVPTKEVAINSMSSADAKWLEKMEEWVMANIQDDRLSVSMLCDAMMVSERQLQRKVKLLTGMSPNQYIRNARLYAAYDLLNTQKFATVSEVAHAVGFSDKSYFSEIFLDLFGKKPSEMLK